MLRPDFLFRNRALWEKRAGAEVNKAAFEAPAVLNCRAEIRRGAQDVRGRIFLPANCGIGPGDRITLDGEKYLLKSVEAFSTHTEGELI